VVTGYLKAICQAIWSS